MHKPLAAAVLALVLASPALAQDMPDYVDNRSTAQSLVESFYNAVNRQEYSRAYTYFAEGATAQSFEDFAAGYAETVHVHLVTGAPDEDAGMSSVHYKLPVAIDAEMADGSHQRFAGCYTVRFTQPSVQDPPVRPMQIEAAHLEPAKGDLGTILPTSCTF